MQHHSTDSRVLLPATCLQLQFVVQHRFYCTGGDFKGVANTEPQIRACLNGLTTRGLRTTTIWGCGEWHALASVQAQL